MGFFDGDAMQRLLDRFGGGPDDPRERRKEPTRSVDVESAAVALENFRRALEPDHEDRVQLARARIMAEERATEMFGCGIVAVAGPVEPDPWHEVGPSEDVVPVTVMVTATSFIVLREGEPDTDEPPMVEAGRFARDAFVDATVTDTAGTTVPEPSDDSFAAPVVCLLAVRWRGSDGAIDGDAFAFRSAWVAAEAARRFRRAAVTPA